MKKFFKALIGLFIGLLLCVVSFLVSSSRIDQPNPAPGLDITFIDGPKTHDGRVDYQTVLRQRQMEDVTPDNNAFIDLLRLLGPRGIILREGKMPDQYWTELGIEPMPENGNYLEWPEVMKDFESDGWQTAYRGWCVEQAPEVASWFKVNSSRIDHFFETVRTKSHYYSPASDETRTPYVLCYMGADRFAKYRLGNLLRISAMQRIGQGDLDAAWRDITFLRRLAALEQKYGSTYDTHLSSHLTMLATDTFESWINHPDFDMALAKRYLEEWNRLPRPTTLAESEFLVDRVAILDTLQDLQDGILDDEHIHNSIVFYDRLPGRLNMQASMRELNELMDRMAEAASTPDAKVRREFFERLGKELYAKDAELRKKLEWKSFTSVASMLFNPRARHRNAGEITVSSLTMYLGWGQAYVEATTAMLDVSQVALALLAWRNDHGEFPEQLQQLVPQYLESVPIDVFDGQPLKYQCQGSGFLVYSVGGDSVDNGGIKGYVSQTKPDTMLKETDIVIAFDHNRP